MVNAYQAHWAAIQISVGEIISSPLIKEYAKTQSHAQLTKDITYMKRVTSRINSGFNRFTIMIPIYEECINE